MTVIRPESSLAAGQWRTRRRDRRGRGVRGPLLPTVVPAARTRSDYFDDLVLSTLASLDDRWRSRLDGTEFAVELVPPSDPAPWEHGGVRLGRVFGRDVGLRARIVLYRRPIETRCTDRCELALLIRDVLIEHIAVLLEVDADDIM